MCCVRLRVRLLREAWSRACVLAGWHPNFTSTSMRCLAILAFLTHECALRMQKEVLKLYGDKPIPFPDFVRNRHNSRWEEGDWWEFGCVSLSLSLPQSGPVRLRLCCPLVRRV